MYLQKYKINYMNYDITEQWEDAFNRPRGSGDYDFILFKCDILIDLGSGYEPAYPGSCIIYTPDNPQYYQAHQCRLKNDYIHFILSKDNDILDRLNIPFNKIFYPVNVDYLSSIVGQIHINMQLNDSYSQENIDSLMTHLLITISRENEHNIKYKKNPYKKELWDLINNARREILKNLDRDWTVKEMAKMCNLSESRFSVLYNEFFNTSPMSDLIKNRINHAKYLLSNDVKSISEIAALLGYNNVFHFIRQFKQYTGFTPLQYRNTI